MRRYCPSDHHRGSAEVVHSEDLAHAFTSLAREFFFFFCVCVHNNFA